MLCAVVAAETSVLASIFKETMWLAGLYQTRVPSPPAERLEQALGKSLPAFALRDVDSEDIVSEKTLRGRFAVLLFLTLGDVLAIGDGSFRSMVAGLSSHADDLFYIVCEGNDAEARWVRERLGVTEIQGTRIRVLAAYDASLRAQFRIRLTPFSVVVDELGFVSRVGRPLPNSGGRDLEDHHAA